MDRLGWKRRAISAVKLAVAVLVVWAVGRHVLRTWGDIKRHDVAVAPELTWLVASGLLYLAGLSCCARFYERVLSVSPSPIALYPAVRAYLISHLGKYVPGKAMVVVMRAGLSVPYGSRAATAAIATFYETLVMMAAGALVAAIGFAVAGSSPAIALDVPIAGRIGLEVYQVAALLSLALAIAFLGIVAPPVFRRLVLIVSLPFPRDGGEVAPRLSIGLMARGLLWTGAAWLLLGFSQLAAVRAFAPLSQSQYLSLVPVVTASVALATVAGFVVAVMPGGLGVREGVLMYALAPAFGDDVAVIAALALRLVWVAAEVLAAGVLLPLRPRVS
jgi:hypothetical protein